MRGSICTAAYAVEAAELAWLRRASAGAGWWDARLGFANKALWRALKLDTLVWAHMYYVDRALRDSKHRDTACRAHVLTVDRTCNHLQDEDESARQWSLSSLPTFWMRSSGWRLGFEIIDCVYAVLEVSAVGLRGGIPAPRGVGTSRESRSLGADIIPGIVEQLPRFKVRLTRNGELIEEGSGRNSLRSPALCLGESAAAIARQPRRAAATGEP